MSTFGNLLRQYRKQCTDPPHGRPLTQSRLAELLEQEPSTGSYTGAAISHWEKGKYRIDHDDRGVLVGLIRVFCKRGGIKTLGEAEALLKAGNYRDLDESEIRHISPAWMGEKPEQKSHPPAIAAAEPHVAHIAPQLESSSQPSPTTGGTTFARPPPPFMTPPLPPQGLVGREDDLKQILDLLALKRPDASDVPPLALRGMGGVGKTTLAIALGRMENIADHFPDGVLWAALGPRPTIRTLLDQWGRALGVDLRALPDEAACQERLRAVLFHRRALLLVDDIWDVGHGQALAVGGPRCRMLLTTREAPIAHDLATSARTMRVDILSPEASLDLLRRLAPAAVTDEKNARRLCERLEFLPLALTLAGKWLANEADVPKRMGRLAQELIERREARLQLLQVEGRLGLTEEEPVSLQAILGMSVERLGQTDQERFAMQSVFGGEPLTWDINAAAHIWECSVEKAERTIAHFIQRGLVERHHERYWMHALLVDYAEDMRVRMNL